MIKSLFQKPGIIGIVGNTDEAKSNLVYHILDTLSKEGSFKAAAYGLKFDFPNVKSIYSVEELEQVKNSIIFLDEFYNLFDLNDRKKTNLIEKILRLIYHNNNILVLIGTSDNFKKYISARLDAIIYKKVTFAEMINGSRVKTILMNYEGNEKGSSVLDLEKNEALLFDGKHYSTMIIPYYENYDSKKANKEIFREYDIKN